MRKEKKRKVGKRKKEHLKTEIESKGKRIERKKEKVFFFVKQKTAYEIYKCDWSSDVCSSDLFN